MNFYCVYLQSFVLAVINTFAIIIGYWCHSWLITINPIAAQIPVSTLLSIGMFVAWGTLFDSQPLKPFGIQKNSDFFRVFRLSLAWGPVIFIPLHYFTQKHLLSFGSLLALWIFQTIVNTGTLLIFYTLQQNPFSSLKRRFFQNQLFSRLIALSIGFFFSLLLLGIIEGIFYQINIMEKSEKHWSYPDLNVVKYLQYDELLGYKPTPNAIVNSVLTEGEQVLYDVTYSIDEYSRRITPVHVADSKPEFALFGGDSFTIGEGVEAHETLPFYFATMNSHYQPYNYGSHGYGPQQLLAKLESGTLQQEIEQKTGILIYIYLEEDHEARAIGTMEVNNEWGANMPYYTFNAQRTLSRRGNFTTGRPFKSQLYRMLGKSQLLKYFDFNLPLSIQEKHYAFTAAILTRARDLFEQQFQSDHFYVIFYPKRHAQKRIFPYLEEANIRYFDYSELFDPSDADYHLNRDRHPSPKAYRTIASHLAQDLHMKEDLITRKTNGDELANF